MEFFPYILFCWRVIFLLFSVQLLNIWKCCTHVIMFLASFFVCASCDMQFAFTDVPYVQLEI